MARHTSGRGRSRPWRALAFIPDATAPHGRRRELAARTSACTEDGLLPFIQRHRRQGHALQVFKVQELDVDAKA